MDRHPPPQSLPLPPLRHPLNLQNPHVTREVRGVPSYAVSYATRSEDARARWIPWWCTNRILRFRAIRAADSGRVVLDHVYFEYILRADICPSRSRLLIDATLTEASHRQCQLCWFQVPLQRKGAYDSCCVGADDRSEDVRVR